MPSKKLTKQVAPTCSGVSGISAPNGEPSSRGANSCGTALRSRVRNVEMRAADRSKTDAYTSQKTDNAAYRGVAMAAVVSLRLRVPACKRAAQVKTFETFLTVLLTTGLHDGCSVLRSLRS